MISIERVHEMLEEIADTFPAAFFEELNGGICLLPEAKHSPHALKNSQLYILGEYHHNQLGRYIYLYYGSFCRIYGHLGEEDFYEKLRHTVAHEFTHHLENLGGQRDLEIQDELDMLRYLAEDE